MINPTDSTPSNTVYTPAADAAEVGSSSPTDTSSITERELTAPHQKGSVSETPQQPDIWSPHLTGQGLNLSLARSMYRLLPAAPEEPNTAVGHDDEPNPSIAVGHDEETNTAARLHYEPSPSTSARHGYEPRTAVGHDEPSPSTSVRHGYEPITAVGHDDPSPSTAVGHDEPSTAVGHYDAKPSKASEQPQSDMQPPASSKNQWKSVEERTASSFKDIVAGKTHFAIHGNQAFLDRHIEAASQSKLTFLGKGAFKTTFEFIGKENKLVAATINMEEIRQRYPTDSTTITFTNHELKMAKDVYRLKMPCVIEGGVLENTATGDCHIFTKKCSEGDVKHVWAKASPDEKAQLLLDYATGLKSLHKEGYVHRDVKGSNMFVDRDENGKLRGLVGDLGCITNVTNPSLEHTYNPVVADHHVLAKGSEVYRHEKATGSTETVAKAKFEQAKRAATHDPKMDTFAFGLMICCLELGCDQDNPNKEFQELKKAMNTKIDPGPEIEEFINKAFPDDKHPLKELVKGMMASDRGKRPSDDEICTKLSEIAPNASLEAAAA